MAGENNFVQIYDQKKRKRLIKKEKARLMAFFGEKDDIASGLIDLAATQRIILEETSAVEVHTKYSSEYVKTISALANLRGADGGKADDEFLQFIARRSK